MVEELRACIASAHDIQDTRQNCDVARFLRVHGQALVEAVEDSERLKWILARTLREIEEVTNLNAPPRAIKVAIDIDIARTKARAGEPK